MSANFALQMRDLSKRFGSHAAVDGLTWGVPRGAIAGFVGPNGSGKTTALRMAMNLVLPDGGSIEVLGSASLAAVRDRVGYLPEERGLYRAMTVGEQIRYFARLKGAGGPRLESSMEGWLRRLGLAGWAGRRVEELSKGMAQKVQFIAAAASEPELLILDEPFSGLDPLGAREMGRAIRDFRAQGGTVILSTHDLPAAEGLCDRVAMMHRGRKVLDQPMKRRRGAPSLQARFLRIARARA